MDDSKEVKKAQKGNIVAFEHLILKYNELMYRVSKTILTGDQDCADAIQETVLKAYQKIHTLREPAYFKTWLLKILMNESYTILRQKRNIIPMESWTEPSEKDKGYESFEIEDLLNRLPEEQRQLIKLFHIEDMSIHDLSEIYNVPENTIKTRLRRAREKMRESLLIDNEEVFQWKNGKEK